MARETLDHWEGAVWAFYQPDGLGSIRQATDGDGAVTSSREWTPFGPALSEVEGVEVGTAQAGLGYTGAWYQPYTQFAYLRARWYDPQTGRFTQRDPFPGLPSWPQSQNSYPYAANSPALQVDPSGECIPCIVLIAAGLTMFLSGCVDDGPLYCPDTMSYAECYNKGYIRVTAQECIREDEFLELQRAIYQDLQSRDPKPGKDPARSYFDTPFFNGRGIPDDEICLCSEEKCCRRSEVNYFAQGMWGAAAGETLEETLDLVEWYKDWRYDEPVTECVIFWTTYGYEAYKNMAEN
jgi:RHS repeat-associated protein